LVARYFRRRFALAIAVMFFISLGMSIWVTRAYPGAAFYLAPVRAWELLLGALLATRVLPETRSASLANLLGLVGLLCIGYSVVAFSTATSFPGANALIPTIGAALIIYCALAAKPWVRCAPHNDTVLAVIEAAHIKRVILHAEWAYYVHGLHYGRVEGAAPEILLTPSKQVEDNYAKFDELLRATLAELQRRHLNVTIVASVPEAGVNVPALALRKAMSGSLANVTLAYADFAQYQTRTFESIRRAASEFGVYVVYPHELMCDATTCALLQNGGALYTDDNHISVRGAMLFEPTFARLLTESSPARP
jgi:SGNH domain (fused to AT3 domains)